MKLLFAQLALFTFSLALMTGCKVKDNLGTTQMEKTSQEKPRETKTDQTSTAAAAILEFTDSNFQSAVVENEGVTLVEFWAEWCGPCRVMNPIIEELAQDYNGKVAIGKVNVDFNPEVSMQYGIRSIPAILILKDGKVVDKQIGTTSMKVLAEKIDAQL